MSKTTNVSFSSRESIRKGRVPVKTSFRKRALVGQQERSRLDTEDPAQDTVGRGEAREMWARNRLSVEYPVSGGRRIVHRPCRGLGLKASCRVRHDTRIRSSVGEFSGGCPDGRPSRTRDGPIVTLPLVGEWRAARCSNPELPSFADVHHERLWVFDNGQGHGGRCGCCRERQMELFRGLAVGPIERPERRDRLLTFFHPHGFTPTDRVNR